MPTACPHGSRNLGKGTCAFASSYVAILTTSTVLADGASSRLHAKHRLSRLQEVTAAIAALFLRVSAHHRSFHGLQHRHCSSASRHFCRKHKSPSLKEDSSLLFAPSETAPVRLQLQDAVSCLPAECQHDHSDLSSVHRTFDRFSAVSADASKSEPLQSGSTAAPELPRAAPPGHSRKTSATDCAMSLYASARPPAPPGPAAIS